MLPRKELDKVVEIAEKYGVGKLYLLGSALSGEPEKAHDYDFAVDGVPEGDFFKFYSELYMAMPKSVDLIDLSGKMNKFKSFVAREGKLIYEKRAA
jgi:predicted nucleotidyltransferase